MKDRLNYNIEVGNFIAYGIRSGNSGTLSTGRVMKIKEDGIVVRGFERKEIGYDHEARSYIYEGYNLKGASGTIGAYKVVVLPDSMIPEEVKSLYA